jgi:hypothetical protein
VFAVATALTNMPYFLYQPSILWPPILWAGVFTGINLYQIWRIYRERRPVALSPDEQTLYDIGFHSLTPRDFVALVMVGAWNDAAAGDTLMREGQPVPSVCIAIRGRVRIHRHGKDLGLLEPGYVVGTAVALMGTASAFDATFTEAGRYKPRRARRIGATTTRATGQSDRRLHGADDALVRTTLTTISLPGSRDLCTGQARSRRARPAAAPGARPR